MKIDNSLKSVGGLPAEDTRPGKGQPRETGAKPAEGVSVDLSPLSGQLKALEGRLSSGEVVDAARVGEIKQAITEGRFRVNPEVVADRLLATVQELIRAYRG